MPAEVPKRLRLPRVARIKQSRDFSRVRRDGHRAVCGCLIANWRPLAQDTRARVGVVVSRKVGGAVNRSRARRLLRESFRVHQHELAQPIDLVLVARPSIAGLSFAAVERDFLAVLRRGGMMTPAPL